jgi:hypothetical protein
MEESRVISIELKRNENKMRTKEKLTEMNKEISEKVTLKEPTIRKQTVE